MHFYKYQATGNDFILVDNRRAEYALSSARIKQLCNPKWGIGADGLITINRTRELDFEMIYYNSDGTKSLCGNGCRAAVSLAVRLGIVEKRTVFSAFDGAHEAVLLDNGQVRLKMRDVCRCTPEGNDFRVDTGSPHYIRFVRQLAEYNVTEKAREIRYSKKFCVAGINVNFVEPLSDDVIALRTYERGVESETLSCGTGAVAAALVASWQGYTSPISVETQGGILQIEFKSLEKSSFSDIFITGPAKMTFEGNISLLDLDN